MQTISTNPVTQSKHGPYNAVDISPSPDPYYYAPEDGTVTALGDSGTCGLRLVVTGASGRHGFCHNESSLVKAGDQVKRGQKLAKMGYTGYTLPSGPGGTHVHWVLEQNGVYKYPPDLVNETFIGGSMATDALTREEIIIIYQLAFDNNDVPENLIGAYAGKPLQGLLQQLQSDPSYKAHKLKVNSPTGPKFKKVEVYIPE